MSNTSKSERFEEHSKMTSRLLDTQRKIRRIEKEIGQSQLSDLDFSKKVHELNAARIKEASLVERLNQPSKEIFSSVCRVNPQLSYS